MTTRTSVRVPSGDAEDDPALRERLLRAVEPELADAGVDPEQVVLESIELDDGNFAALSVEVSPR